MTSDATTFRDAMPTRGEGRSSVVRLRDLVARALGGGTPSTADPSYWDGMIPWTTSAIIGQDDIYLTQYQRRITERGLAESATNVAPKGAVLVGTRVGVGKTAVTTFDVAVSQDLTILIPTLQVLPEFLALSLKAPSIQRWFEQNKRGTTIKGVPREDVLSLKIALPPLAEQRATADALLAIRRAREAADAVLAATRELKRSLLRHLFTFGPVSIEDADKVPLKKTEVGLAPKHWRVAELGTVASIERGKFAHRPRNDPRYYGGAVPFIQTGDVTTSNGIVSTYSQTLNELGLSVSRIFPKGTIVMTIAANIGYCATLGFDSAFPDSLVGIVPHQSLYRDYLLQYLRTQQGAMDRLASRGTQKNINIQFLKPWPVLIPPASDQVQIASCLASIDRKLAAEEQHWHALDTLFKSLLDQLMTGKIRVPTGAPMEASDAAG